MSDQKNSVRDVENIPIIKYTVLKKSDQQPTGKARPHGMQSAIEGKCNDARVKRQRSRRGYRRPSSAVEIEQFSTEIESDALETSRLTDEGRISYYNLR